MFSFFPYVFVSSIYFIFSTYVFVLSVYFCTFCMFFFYSPYALFPKFHFCIIGPKNECYFILRKL
ncbi:hypothetical protein BD779DRAFT_1547353 [Infundibulicybe gibba]|nr:hypothetical protein BD779DRAFT_1603026 [Infundibulicybe gibba]KAF8869559.1 hypothetical protein BD779DRAFT_1585287 [Infundibulicybe gibba]KAF8880834.1 hypothetical protein BD779DRAFT_1547353 [Infundibulicybe gibba]